MFDLWGTVEWENKMFLGMLMNPMHMFPLTVSSNTIFPSTGANPSTMKCTAKLQL